MRLIIKVPIIDFVGLSARHFLRVVVASFRWASASEPSRKEKLLVFQTFQKRWQCEMMRLWGKRVRQRQK